MSESSLAPGETLDLRTRVGGGPTIHRDKHCTDGFGIDGHGGELYRDEVRRLAEAAGLTVVDDNE